jgi:putative cell wall-binding protein
VPFGPSRRLSGLLLATMMMVSVNLSTAEANTRPDPEEGATKAQALTIEQVGGRDRIATAIQLSRQAFPRGATGAVLARADQYPDALAGAPLAASLEGPLLLTPPTVLDARVGEELRRLGVQRVVLLGGPAALSSAVERAVTELNVTLERIAGSDRFETAARVAHALEGPTHGFVVEGWNPDPTRGWPDAVAVSGYAAHRNAPILLVTRDRLPDTTRSALKGLRTVTIIGGTAAVSDSVMGQIRGTVPAVGRLAGRDRYETSVRVADEHLRELPSPLALWVGSGQVFADALAAGPTSAAMDGVLLLIDGIGGSGNGTASQWLSTHSASWGQATFVGGVRAIAVYVREQLGRAIQGEVPPVGGPGASPSTGQWRGVLHTDYDVELWRSRRSGHAFSFDWDRIVAHKDAFLSNPGHQLSWDGSNWDTSGGCINTPQPNYQASLPPHVGPRRLRDAAFYTLVAHDAPDAAAVRREVASRLVSIAAINNHDMSNRSRFCYSSRNWDLPPYFDYAQWWTHIFLAYDFIGRDAFTASQRQALDTFFYHAADAYRGQNSVVNAMTTRWGASRFDEPPSWNFSSASCSSFGAAWDGGPTVPEETSWVQNRRHFNSFHMTAIGLYLKQHGFTPPPSNPGNTLDQIIAGGRALAYETIAVYWGPNALFSELHRGNSNSPNQGMFYQSMTNGHAALTAEMFARLGQTDLIDYQTTTGMCGWHSSTPKSFGYAARSIAEYHARVYSSRRWNNVIIDGGSNHVADAWTAITNAWWNDNYVRAGYMRQHANNRPWPSNPSGLHGATGWEEPGSTLPGVLFMFGQREGDRTVYPGA